MGRAAMLGRLSMTDGRGRRGRRGVRGGRRRSSAMQPVLGGLQALERLEDRIVLATLEVVSFPVTYHGSWNLLPGWNQDTESWNPNTETLEYTDGGTSTVSLDPASDDINYYIIDI